LIPDSIQKADVIAAMKEIDRADVPSRRKSRKFDLVYKGRKYPPKYVLALAWRNRTGQELDPSAFGGGNETNNFLQDRGFFISSAASNEPLPKSSSPPVATTPLQAENQNKADPSLRAARHSERCAKCKIVVEQLLRSLYGDVERNPKIRVAATPNGYDTQYRIALTKIFTALQAQRGFTSFVRSTTLPRCDFLVPVPGFLVEFDESQHFTKSRQLALSLYPKSLPIGFDREAWIRLCEKINARDNHPPFRDEQRAWYDTLRDFLPLTKGMLPTIRLYSGERRWCDFNPNKSGDVESFRQILGDWASFWKVDFVIPSESRLARISIDGHWRGDIELARKLLRDICANWPSDLRVLSLSACGAFLTFKFPSGIVEQANNWSPSREAISELEHAGQAACEALLRGGLREELGTRADFLSIGVDTAKPKISFAEQQITTPHAELVYVANLKTGSLHFTGKSYPTIGQEKGLLRIADLESHFLEMNGAAAMVLGCHDLTIFNPRSDARVKQPERVEVKEKFKLLCNRTHPSIVLHHPHTTIKAGTWRNAWANLKRTIGSVKSYVGTGCYSHEDDWANRDQLTKVLKSTKSLDVMDIVVHMAMCPSRAVS